MGIYFGERVRTNAERIAEADRFLRECRVHGVGSRYPIAVNLHGNNVVSVANTPNVNYGSGNDIGGWTTSKEGWFTRDFGRVLGCEKLGKMAVPYTPLTDFAIGQIVRGLWRLDRVGVPLMEINRYYASKVPGSVTWKVDSFRPRVVDPYENAFVEELRELLAPFGKSRDEIKNNNVHIASARTASLERDVTIGEELFGENKLGLTFRLNADRNVFSADRIRMTIPTDVVKEEKLRSVGTFLGGNYDLDDGYCKVRHARISPETTGQVISVQNTSIERPELTLSLPNETRITHDNFDKEIFFLRDVYAISKALFENRKLP